MHTARPSAAKRFLASLSLLITTFLLISIAGTEPAAAVAPDNEMTLDGITMKWTKADMSDVVVTETPGKVDKLPNGLTADELEATAAEGAGSQSSRRFFRPVDERSTNVDERSTNDASQAEPNGCSFSPDRWFKANFKPTCDTHDRCYSPSSSQDRLTCDQTFHRGLNGACYGAYSGTTIRLNTCYAVAATYYVAVRNFGRSSYNGSGRNN